MTKGIKITSDSQIIIVDDFENDESYINNVLSGYSLSLPQFWEHKQYMLTVFIVDRYDSTHEYNHIATHIFNKLYNTCGEVDQDIRGFMIICNEDENEPIDFTLDDYHYLIKQMKNLEYLPRASRSY